MHDFLLRNATLPDGSLVDVAGADGRVDEVVAVGTGGSATTTIDAEGGLVLPAPAEPHAHLDKALTADLVLNPAGDLFGAIQAWQADYESRSVPEISGRANTALVRMVQAGYTAVRTHVDLAPGIDLQAVEALTALREQLSDVIDIQVCALVAPPVVGPGSSATRALVAEAVSAGVDVLGGVPYVESDIREATAWLLETAAAAGLPVDLHVDETLDPTVLGLEDLAELAIDFPFAVAASHCCSLGMADEATQRRVAEKVAAAGVAVITLPQTNLFLQSRDRPVAAPRGLTAIAALRDAGVVVAAGADNLQDPFNTVGRADAFETAALMVMAGHVDAATGWTMASNESRGVLGLAAAGPSVGAVADLLVVPSLGTRAAVADAPAERLVIRGGREVARTRVHLDLHPDLRRS